MDAAGDVQAREGKAEPRRRRGEAPWPTRPPRRSEGSRPAWHGRIRGTALLGFDIAVSLGVGRHGLIGLPRTVIAGAMAKQLLSTKSGTIQLGVGCEPPWAPMSVDATLAIRGARPVAFEQPSVQAEASGQLSFKWETLEDDGIKIAGRLTTLSYARWATRTAGGS